MTPDKLYRQIARTLRRNLSGWAVTRTSTAGVSVLLCTRGGLVCLLRVQAEVSERQQKALDRIEASGVHVHVITSVEQAWNVLDPDRIRYVELPRAPRLSR